MTWYRTFIRWLADYEIALEVRKAIDFARLSADARVAAVQVEMLALQAQLAESELAKSQAAQMAYEVAVQLEAAEKLAHALGELEGQQRMADCVLQSVRERTGGADDLVQERDIEAARKRSVH